VARRVGWRQGYRAGWIDDLLLELGIKPVIPSKENEDRTARPVEFDCAAYRKRSIVECLIGWLKECRRVLTRFESRRRNYGRHGLGRVYSTISSPHR